MRAVRHLGGGVRAAPRRRVASTTGFNDSQLELATKPGQPSRRDATGQQSAKPAFTGSLRRRYWFVRRQPSGVWARIATTRALQRDSRKPSRRRCESALKADPTRFISHMSLR